MKQKFSKWLVPVVILLNVGFSVGLILAMKNGMIEPTRLIDRWFDFTGTELIVMGGITGAKVTRDIFMKLFDMLKEKYKKRDE